MKKYVFFILFFLFSVINTEGKFTQNFKKNGLVPKDILEMNSRVQADLTIGRVSKEAVTKYQKIMGNTGKLVEAAASGKGFEALAVEKYKQCSSFSNRSLCSTAALNSSQDATDVLKFNKKTRRILKKYQFKKGYGIAKDAITNPSQISKYSDCIIVTTKDSFEKIQNDLRKEILKKKANGKPLSQNWQRIRDAIKNHKLTDSIDDVVMPTTQECELYTKRIKHIQWDQLAKVEKTLSKKSTKIGIKAMRKLLNKYLKTGGKYFTRGVTCAGYAYSAYQIYDTWDSSYHGRMDKDIAVVRIGNATAQIAFETMGPYIISTLSIPGGGWVAGGIMLAGTAGFVALDLWITNVQERRNAENRRLLKKIDLVARCDAAKTVLKYSYMTGT